MEEEEEAASKPALPDAFLDFLKENGLDPSIYYESQSTPRYIRLKPGFEDRIEEIEAEIKCKLEEVEWLPGFYALPPAVQIANSNAYREGKIYGIDAASGAAVSALNISSGDHVLDLCAAPGAKLCMISDLLGNSGSITGVDVSSHRLAACRTMLQKYALGNLCRLFVADGTTFSLVPTRVLSDPKSCESILEENVTFKEWTSRRPWKERKEAARVRKNGAVRSGNQLPELIYYGRHSGVVGLTKSELYQTFRDSEYLSCGYDKVLVDAECTHDGSIKHVQKFEQWGWETLQRRVLDAERSDSLTVLQLKLLTNGFRLLKSGGILVYSTCSLTVAQNEEVVKQFLEGNPCAELQAIDAAENWPCKNGRVPNTLRFDPVTSKTSGLFVAKFSKLTI
ncbi:rRNA (cytosine-C(5))-methyltransferase NOP2C isoform X1 [Pyrus x bretschneideri]|uniref:rRNA (cytosine-C(5))-methyltransferase NOP2C isoform X1 n=1 Tax=Pyrus x bretschneideri TaxID=225117 RepID=UPI000511291A|nr:rRNA (cytosine-C(5))-methyltransferase NOP2C isoform X1 [Pyrus x bretschneideri]